MNRGTLILFDMDGTLIDSQDHIVSAMNYALDRSGVSVPDRGDILSIVGLSLPEAVARLVPHAAPNIQAAVIEDYRHSFSDKGSAGRKASAIQLYPGAREVLDDLVILPSVLLGVATGKGKRGLDQVYRSLDLTRYFQTSQTSDSHPSKPHPSMILSALAETGSDPLRTVMIGDTTYDIEMGRAAGVATVGVTWGYHSRDSLGKAGADLVLENFSDIPAAVDTLVGLRA